MVELLANSGDPDQMQHFLVFDLGLCCLPITFLGVSRPQLVKSASNQGTSNEYPQDMF